jgi:hypothetical protein
MHIAVVFPLSARSSTLLSADSEANSRSILPLLAIAICAPMKRKRVSAELSPSPAAEAQAAGSKPLQASPSSASAPKKPRGANEQEAAAASSSASLSFSLIAQSHSSTGSAQSAAPLQFHPMHPQSHGQQQQMHIAASNALAVAHHQPQHAQVQQQLPQLQHQSQSLPQQQPPSLSPHLDGQTSAGAAQPTDQLAAATSHAAAGGGSHTASHASAAPASGSGAVGGAAASSSSSRVDDDSEVELSFSTKDYSDAKTAFDKANEALHASEVAHRSAESELTSCEDKLVLLQTRIEAAAAKWEEAKTAAIPVKKEGHEPPAAQAPTAAETQAQAEYDAAVALRVQAQEQIRLAQLQVEATAADLAARQSETNAAEAKFAAADRQRQQRETTATLARQARESEKRQQAWHQQFVQQVVADVSGAYNGRSLAVSENRSEEDVAIAATLLNDLSCAVAHMHPAELVHLGDEAVHPFEFLMDNPLVLSHCAFAGPNRAPFVQVTVGALEVQTFSHAWRNYPAMIHPHNYEWTVVSPFGFLSALSEHNRAADSHVPPGINDGMNMEASPSHVLVAGGTLLVVSAIDNLRKLHLDYILHKSRCSPSRLKQLLPFSETMMINCPVGDMTQQGKVAVASGETPQGQPTPLEAARRDLKEAQAKHNSDVRTLRVTEKEIALIGPPSEQMERTLRSVSSPGFIVAECQKALSQMVEKAAEYAKQSNQSEVDSRLAVKAAEERVERVSSSTVASFFRDPTASFSLVASCVDHYNFHAPASVVGVLSQQGQTYFYARMNLLPPSTPVPWQMDLLGTRTHLHCLSGSLHIAMVIPTRDNWERLMICLYHTLRVSLGEALTAVPAASRSQTPLHLSSRDTALMNIALLLFSTQRLLPTLECLIKFKVEYRSAHLTAQQHLIIQAGTPYAITSVDGSLTRYTSARLLSADSDSILQFTAAMTRLMCLKLNLAKQLSQQHMKVFAEKLPPLLLKKAMNTFVSCAAVQCDILTAVHRLVQFSSQSEESGDLSVDEKRLLETLSSHLAIGSETLQNDNGGAAAQSAETRDADTVSLVHLEPQLVDLLEQLHVAGSCWEVDNCCNEAMCLWNIATSPGLMEDSKYVTDVGPEVRTSNCRRGFAVSPFHVVD